MKILETLANRFSTPPKDPEWEHLWGEQEPVGSVRSLFPYFIAALILSPLSLIFGMPYLASFAVAIIYLFWKLRSALFSKARVAMDGLEPRDYAGIFFYILPVMVGIWVFVGAFLAIFLNTEDLVN